MSKLGESCKNGQLFQSECTILSHTSTTTADTLRCCNDKNGFQSSICFSLSSARLITPLPSNHLNFRYRISRYTWAKFQAINKNNIRIKSQIVKKNPQTMLNTCFCSHKNFQGLKAPLNWMGISKNRCINITIHRVSSGCGNARKLKTAAYNSTNTAAGYRTNSMRPPWNWNVCCYRTISNSTRVTWNSQMKRSTKIVIRSLYIGEKSKCYCSSYFRYDQYATPVTSTRMLHQNGDMIQQKNWRINSQTMPQIQQCATSLRPVITVTLQIYLVVKLESFLLFRR